MASGGALALASFVSLAALPPEDLASIADASPFGVSLVASRIPELAALLNSFVGCGPPPGGLRVTRTKHDDQDQNDESAHTAQDPHDGRLLP